MPYAILRFEKHAGATAYPLEAHHERKKEKYASNPDIDKNRSGSVTLPSAALNATPIYRQTAKKRWRAQWKDCFRKRDSLSTCFQILEKCLEKLIFAIY